MTQDENKVLDESIQETIDEMQSKIDEITKECEGVEDNELGKKISELKDRTVDLLSKTAEKIKTSAVEIKDSEKLNQLVAYAKEKSRILADSTIAKIKELKESASKVDLEGTAAKANDSISELKDKVVDKVNEVKNDPNTQVKLDQLKVDLKDAFETVKSKSEEAYDKLMENDKVRETVDVVSTATNKVIDDAVRNTKEYFERPDVKENVQKAKDVTVDIAEKAKDVTVDVAEKTFDALKKWLKPESEE